MENAEESRSAHADGIHNPGEHILGDHSEMLVRNSPEAEGDVLPGNDTSTDTRGMRHAIESADTPANLDSILRDIIKSPYGWTKGSRDIWEHENTVIRHMQNEINAFLTFAGLFSAVVTAFIVPFYSNLQPEYPHLTQLDMLQFMSLQISSFVIGGGFVNSTAPSPETFVNNFLGNYTSLPEISPAPLYINVNALWLSALVCTLAAATIAISVKQWLHQHVMGVNCGRSSVSIWLHRRGNHKRWGIPTIISCIPILLQVAVAMFPAGLAIVFWSLDPTIGYVVWTLTVALLFFLLATTIAPAFMEECPYRSTQAWLVVMLCHFVKKLVSMVCRSLYSVLQHYTHRLKFANTVGNKIEVVTKTMMKATMHTKDMMRRSSESVIRAYKDATVEIMPRDWVDFDHSSPKTDVELIVAVDKILRDDAILESLLDPVLSSAPLIEACKDLMAVLDARARTRLPIKGALSPSIPQSSPQTASSLTRLQFGRARAHLQIEEWGGTFIAALLKRVEVEGDRQTQREARALMEEIMDKICDAAAVPIPSDTRP